MAEIACSAEANGATANRSFARMASEISRRLVSSSMTTIMGVKPDTVAGTAAAAGQAAPIGDHAQGAF